MKWLSRHWKRLKITWLPYVVAYLGEWLLTIILKTCTIHVRGLENFREAAENGKCILMLWHNRLGPMVQFLKLYGHLYNYGALISKSKDGDMLAKLVNRYYPQGRAIRVAHDAKHQGLRDVIHHLNRAENIIIVITPDGPRGPCYQVKPGVVVAAKAASAKIVPMTWTGSSFWELKSWDKFRIPKPFSKILVSFGEGVAVPSEDPDSPGKHQEDLRERLLSLEL